MDLEQSIEATQEGDSSISSERLIYNQLDIVIDYISFKIYKEGSKSKKISTMDTIKVAFCNKHLCHKLCTEKYLFLLIEARKNSSLKKISETIVETSYEVYAESVKTLLENHPLETINIITESKTFSYIEILLKCSDSPHIIDLFPCFFSLSKEAFQKWIDFLIKIQVVDLIVRYITKYRKTHREVQNLFKLLYLFITFTSNIFRKELIPPKNPTLYMHFYLEIGKHLDLLLDSIFKESDAINRLSALEVLKEMIKTSWCIPRDKRIFPTLTKYFESLQLIKSLQEKICSPLVQIQVITLVNIITRTIRFRSTAVKKFFEETDFLSSLIAYLYVINTHTITNEICALINEFIYTDKEFYLEALIKISRQIKECSYAHPQEVFSDSQKPHRPNAIIQDCVTPVLYIIYQLYSTAVSESTSPEPSKNISSVRRFTVTNQKSSMYKLIQELSFLQSDEYHWYKTNRVHQHGQRLALMHTGDPHEPIVNQEQIARYICMHILSLFPDISLFHM
ncbi:hypothetical protein NEFER03_1431 [Nematocida sp. LUAm3]|nr:hypothetical protein NEFER03_1431 [Nematocida sp. LUAm3]KAI5174739.1 hypothetical protein NEFER02_0849 [Nematocida sp. LUAm2]KAI5177850.1 hypothetical protein NEFER01_1052 [Nematocida sp. LUAm1]